MRAGDCLGKETADTSFGELLERYRRGLVALALDRTGRFDAAEEIAQEAISLAWEHRSSLREPEAFGSWLFRIAINCCLQWQRGERRRSSGDASEEAGARWEPVLEQVLRRETMREARRALARVPLKNRLAFLMHLSGHSYQEIASFLEVPVATVRGRLARTRARLKRDLAERLGISLKGGGTR